MLQKLGFFLHDCAKTNDLRRGISLHAAAIKAGRLAETTISTHILNLYSKCGLINSAHQMFDEMPHRNIVSWSAMIAGFDRWDRPHTALQLLIQLQKHFKPNEFVLTSTLSSCARLRELNLGQQIHQLALKLSYCSISFVINSLILLYMKCGRCDDALSVFHDSSPTLVSYNVAITGLVENNLQEKGMELFTIMLRRGLLPDRFTFAGLFSNGEFIYGSSMVMQLHCQMAKLGLDSRAFSGNALMNLYSKLSLFEECERAFRSIGRRDVVSWNTAIANCCQIGDNLKAFDLFREMTEDHYVSPDDYTYASLLSTAAGLASARIGKVIHACLIRARRNWDVRVGNALVNMYGKSGYVVSGYSVFRKMEVRDLVSWNTVIAAFANHGDSNRVLALFEEMTKTGIEPDSVTFLGLLVACNHSGLADEGKMVFNSMSRVYGVTPGVEHLSCLVDLFGRSGRLAEAEEYMREYRRDDDVVVLGSLLSACRLHGDVSMGERIGKRLIQLRPVTTSPYVLLSDLYASRTDWDGVLEARNSLEVGGFRKERARSMIDAAEKVSF